MASDLLLVGDDGKMYRISRSSLDQYEVAHSDPAIEKAPKMAEVAKCIKGGSDPHPMACWIMLVEAGE